MSAVLTDRQVERIRKAVREVSLTSDTRTYNKLRVVSVELSKGETRARNGAVRAAETKNDKCIIAGKESA